MRRIAAALLLLSLAGCDDGADEPPVVIEAQQESTAHAAGQVFRWDVVDPWLEGDGGIRTADRGCGYAASLVALSYDETTGVAFRCGCMASTDGCDAGGELPDDVVWSEDVCDVCEGSACIELLDPTGRC
ncbi:MAG: hypothetical protein ACRBN8_22390 [Nannocystales bacterium]